MRSHIAAILRVFVITISSAMVTAPGCGHLMYGQITQIDYGSTEFASHAATRVPKFSLNQEADIRKLRLGARPLAAPHNYCPYIYAAKLCPDPARKGDCYDEN